MPRDRSEIVVIYWRDIPAQVNAQVGRQRHQVVLPGKFQTAIDRAKRKAKITTAAEDVAQWRRVSRPAGSDPIAEADELAARLEDEYSKDRLGKLAFGGGADLEAVVPEGQP
jgi:Virulence factor